MSERNSVPCRLLGCQPGSSSVSPGMRTAKAGFTTSFAASVPGATSSTKSQRVARRQDCDDVLFELFGPESQGEFAVVHLVWNGQEAE